MKVLVSGYVGKKITGIGRNLISMLDESSNKDIEYVVYTNHDMNKDMQFSNTNVKTKAYNISKNDSFKNLLWTTFMFPFCAIKERADVVLIPNFTLLLLKFRPTVVIMHDLIEFNIKNKFSPKKMFYRTRIADPLTARHADHIVTVSKNSQRDIVKFLGIKADKVTVIYNGVDKDKFQKMDHVFAKGLLAQKGLPDKFILYVGTLDHPGKNAISLVKAFETLKSDNDYDGTLVLSGMPGSGYDILTAYIEKSKYRSDIILTGYVDDQLLVAMYSMCDLFCFLSLYEGFGIPPLEALACGAKVMVSNTSSLPEVVGEVGIVVDPLDINEIAGKIAHALQENGDQKSTERVKKHISGFDWHNSCVELESVLTRSKDARK